MLPSPSWRPLSAFLSVAEPVAESVNEPVAAGRTATAERRALTWMVVALAAVFLLFFEGAISGSDGGKMYAMARSLVEDGNVTVTGDDVQLPGREGGQTRYGMGLPLLAVPAVVAGKAAGAIAGHSDEVGQAGAAALMPLISALLAGAIYRLARRLGAPPGRSALIASGTILGTFALAYTKEFLSEPVAGLALVVMVERSLARKPWAAGIALALGVLVRTQLLVLAPIVALAEWRWHSFRDGVRIGIPLAVAGIAQAAINWWRFGDLLSFGYQDITYSAKWVSIALVGFLVDPLKSIFLFAPITAAIAVAVWQIRRSETHYATLVAGTLLASLGPVLFVFFWQGGWSWGPRYLLFPVFAGAPALAVWASTAPRQRVVAGLFLLGFLFSAATLVVSTRAQQIGQTHVADRGANDGHFDVIGPSIHRQVGAVPATVARVWEEPIEKDPGEGRYYRLPTMWQIGVIRLLGPTGAVAAVVGSAGLVALAVVAARKAISGFRALDSASLGS